MEHDAKLGLEKGKDSDDVKVEIKASDGAGILKSSEPELDELPKIKKGRYSRY